MRLAIPHCLLGCVPLALTAAAMAQGAGGPVPKVLQSAPPVTRLQRPAPPGASLQSARPALVAWAAELAVRGPEAHAATGPQLLAAYERFAGATDDDGCRARRCVLRALYELRVPFPSKQILQLCADGADALQVGLLVRNATPTGGELFELFRRLDPSRPAWEYIGGALATRGHRTFAVETYLGMVPRLHVVVTNLAASGTDRARERAAHDDDESFPEWVDYGWQRDRTGLLEVVPGDARPVPFAPDWIYRDEIVLDAVAVDCARWRWLASLAGMPQPMVFGWRWIVTVPAHLPADLAATVAAAREHAAAACAAIDRAFRERGLVPKDFARTLAQPVVVVHDERAAWAKARWPLPAELTR